MDLPPALGAGDTGEWEGASEGWQRGRLRVERRVEATGKRTHTMHHKAPLSTHTSEERGLLG